MLVFDILKIPAGYIQICSKCIVTTCPPLGGPGDMMIGNALLSQYLRDCYIRYMGGYGCRSFGKRGPPPPTCIQFVCMHDDMYHIARESRVYIAAVHLNNVIETDYR
jgi:hypothetical protein